jgi:hypothetical protein
LEERADQRRMVSRVDPKDPNNVAVRYVLSEVKSFVSALLCLVLVSAYPFPSFMEEAHALPTFPR